MKATKGFRFLVVITITLWASLVTARAADRSSLEAFTTATTVHKAVPGQRPSMCVASNGNLYVAFEGPEKDEGRRDVYFVSSSDAGLSWSSPVNLSMTPAISSHPSIAVEANGSIDVAWSDTRTGETNPDIFFVRSQDAGKSWTQPVDISNTPGLSTEPALTSGPEGSIHVVWTETSKDDKSKDIYYTCSTNGGVVWGKDRSTPVENISNTPGTSIEPAIAADPDGLIHVVWLDGTPGETHPDVFYIYKDGSSWIKPVNVSHSPRVSDHPTVGCASRGRVYVAWLDYSQKPTAPDIWCAIGSAGGRFQKPINISNTPGVSSEPVLAADAKGRVGLVWTDTSKTVLTEHRPDIFTRVSNDFASNFTRVMDISNTPGASEHPDVKIAGSKMFVIWQERQGNGSILELTSIGLDSLATGPPTQVEPAIRGHSSTSR
jgi:hypothetical protein